MSRQWQFVWQYLTSWSMFQTLIKYQPKFWHFIKDDYLDRQAICPRQQKACEYDCFHVSSYWPGSKTIWKAIVLHTILNGKNHFSARFLEKHQFKDNKVKQCWSSKMTENRNRRFGISYLGVCNHWMYKWLRKDSIRKLIVRALCTFLNIT